MIPINIALTGHRDLKEEKISYYKNKVKTILQNIKTKYPNSQIQVLSGMAEGADIIGAQAALEAGCSIVAVLPMEESSFLKTFSNPQNNISEFKNILSKASKVIDLSKVYADHSDEVDAYVQLGLYLTENSQMIIALWNGIYTGSLGGTSSVIKFALEGMPRKYRKVYSIVDRYDTIPVHHVNVERLNSQGGTRPDYIKVVKNGFITLYPSVWKESDSKTMTGYYENQLKEIDIFNKRCKECDGKPTNLKGYNSKDTSLSKGIKEIAQVQNAADFLASKYQKRTNGLLITQLIFGFFVFFWVVLVDEILPLAPYILFLSPVFFLMCVLVSRYVCKSRIEDRYYDYRALAECLRVQYYWKSAAITDNVYSSYSKKNEYELGWVVAAVKNISMDINYGLALGNYAAVGYDSIKENWMVDQLNYFIKKDKTNKKSIGANKKLTYTFFGASLIFVLLLIAERLIFANYYEGEYFMHIFLFLIDVSLASGAIISGYLDKSQLESELKQYTRMVMIFREGIKEFNTVCKENNEDYIKKTVVEMGTDALAENADWVLFNKMNNIDIPMG